LALLLQKEKRKKKKEKRKKKKDSWKGGWDKAGQRLTQGRQDMDALIAYIWQGR
jgi:hypothetical protein